MQRGERDPAEVQKCSAYTSSSDLLPQQLQHSEYDPRTTTGTLRSLQLTGWAHGLGTFFLFRCASVLGPAFPRGARPEWAPRHGRVSASMTRARIMRASEARRCGGLACWAATAITAAALAPVVAPDNVQQQSDLAALQSEVLELKAVARFFSCDCDSNGPAAVTPSWCHCHNPFVLPRKLAPADFVQPWSGPEIS